MTQPIHAGELVPLVVKDLLEQVKAMDATSAKNLAEVKPQPKPLRLILSAEQSAAIRESGIRFAIIHPDSYPSPHVGKWVVDLVECDVHQANAAVRVARGLGFERRPKAPKLT